jgi:hypothetical protein
VDVNDAGAYIYKFVAAVPNPLKVVLWGPLQAKEMGFGDWTYQDGGETGFVYHTAARAIKMGLATATLTYVRRAERAYLTLYLGGYPSDAAREQRLIDVRGLVNEAELFLTKLGQEPIRFELADERALLEPAARPTAAAPKPSRAARTVTWEV